MIELPRKESAFAYENGFYLTCSADRIAKSIAHWELFKKVRRVSGAVVECGVYKGASLSRFAMFRQIAEGAQSKEIVGFDTFGTFPRTEFEADKVLRQRFIDQAGGESISREQLMTVLRNKQCAEGVALIEGDICRTVPEFVEKNPDFRISLLNLDVDIYEPSVIVLEHLFPLIEHGGVLILDDYESFPGETKAADDYFASTPWAIIPSSENPSIHYVVKT